MPTLLKLSHKMEEEETLSNAFCEASVTLIPNPDKNTTRREMDIDAKIFNKMLAKPNSMTN